MSPIEQLELQADAVHTYAEWACGPMGLDAERRAYLAHCAMAHEVLGRRLGVQGPQAELLHARMDADVRRAHGGHDA